MKKLVLGAIVVAALVIWWFAAAPRSEIGCCVAESLVIDPATAEATAAVDRSADFAATLESFASDLPAYDDAIFPGGGTVALVTGHDGRIWRVVAAAGRAEPVADVPLMAWGIHEVPGDPKQAYFCAAGSYEDRQEDETPGLYRLDLETGAVTALATRVPDTAIPASPIVYADSDAAAPTLKADGSGAPGRDLAVCDNLEVSADGQRIYFSEPFAYSDATVDDAIDEAIALAPNGRLFRYDLADGSTRVIAEGFHFINGVLVDPHPGQEREDSVIVTQTSLFQVSRFFVNGPRAGSADVVIDGLPGTPDGVDRDGAGRLWLAMFIDRGDLLTWVHANAWLKPLLMRLPTQLLLATQSQKTGVVVLSPDGSTPLYAAFHEGPELFSIASAVPAADGIYLAHVSLDDSEREHMGVQRLPWPPELTGSR